ncbi:MAG TPA: hypothetical protein VGB76_13810 [Pyrinomonadaceae bacterium]
MSKHRVQVVVEGALLSVFVFLEGTQLKLQSNDSGTYQGAKTLEVKDPLDLIFHAFGVPPTEWKISLTVDGANKPLFEHEGMIGKHNQSVLQQAIPLPQTAAAKGKNK